MDYHSRNFHQAELNYEVWGKERLAIVGERVEEDMTPRFKIHLEHGVTND